MDAGLLEKLASIGLGIAVLACLLPSGSIGNSNLSYRIGSVFPYCDRRDVTGRDVGRMPLHAGLELCGFWLSYQKRLADLVELPCTIAIF